MSKADQLGAGRFGGGVRTVSARRQAVAAATGVPTDGVAPPTELPVDRVSLNPDNPRTSLGDLTDLAGSLKTHGQKQAITVMNRDAYLRANPDQEANLEPDTAYVVVDGSTRLAAAREAGLATVKVMVNDDQGATPDELLESALVANIHREDLEELDEARALQRLLAIHGSQRALAKRLHRSQGWVSQRLALLNLTPELQSRIGEEPIDLLRAVGNRPADQQAAALEELKEQRALKEAAARASRAGGNQEASPRASAADAGGPGEGEGDYGVITDGSTGGGAGGGESGVVSGGSAGSGDYGVITGGDTRGGDYGVITGGGERGGDYGVITRDGGGAKGGAAAPEVIPEPRADALPPKPAAGNGRGTGTAQGARVVPYDQPGALAMLLDAKVGNDDLFFDLLRFLGTKALERDSVRLGKLARALAEQADARGE
ncbi:ParB/RepB/Spo0J family partition protein [Streptomyces sp. NPDC006367]|uniref:ParB/RepB/Spo0J family partition protein n=1 Tax=unclassified Streptomyces TaxID=2593676 RepID=UPI0033B2732C